MTSSHHDACHTSRAILLFPLSQPHSAPILPSFAHQIAHCMLRKRLLTPEERAQKVYAKTMHYCESGIRKQCFGPLISVCQVYGNARLTMNSFNSPLRRVIDWLLALLQ